MKKRLIVFLIAALALTLVVSGAALAQDTCHTVGGSHQVGGDVGSYAYGNWQNEAFVGPGGFLFTHHEDAGGGNNWDTYENNAFGGGTYNCDMPGSFGTQTTTFSNTSSYTDANTNTYAGWGVGPGYATNFGGWSADSSAGGQTTVGGSFTVWHP